MEFVSCNPATGEETGRFCIQDAEEVVCAVAQARKVAVEWGALSVAERCAALERLRVSLARDADALAATVNREIGKPLQEALGADLLPSLNALKWVGKYAPGIFSRRRIAGTKAWQEAVPLGVVGVIGTWNYPLFLNIAPIAWALAAGNAVVWKPSELATASAMQLKNHFERAGLPVFVVTGDGTTGRALCREGCDKVTFTGSARTGRAILVELAQTGTPAVMELSGNDAMIVCADADIEVVARSAVWGRCCNAGQSCVAPQRIYVETAVYRPFLEACRKVIESLRPGIDYGPMRTETVRDQAHRMVWDAVPRGAKLLAGGHALADKPGFFYAPTLLSDCRNDMLVYEQDFFGPVVAVCPVANEAEAIRLANDNDMALGASVWTRSKVRGKTIASQLRVGLVSINEILLDAAAPALPFGGMRGSGFGKQRGAAGLDEFVLWKTVSPHSLGGARRHLFPYLPVTLPILRSMAALQAAGSWRERWQAICSLIEAVKNYKQD